MRLSLLVAAGLAGAALVLAGPGRAYTTLRDAALLIRRGWTAVLLGGLAAGVLALLARRYLDVVPYATDVAAGGVAALAALVLAARFAPPVERVVLAMLRAPFWAIALILAGVGLIACFLVLGNIPHVSDEVAYQFQARTLALGRLSLEVPSVAEPFLFTHTMVDGSRWYGIMNPGWPALLAAGEAARAPWLVNPLLGALTPVVFYRAFRAGGIAEEPSKLAALLLALSPLLCFMAGTYMAHPANLLLFGLFCWAWAVLLETGRLLPALAAGAALGLNLLVRPIDAAAAALPFLLLGLLTLFRRPRLFGPFFVFGIVLALALAATYLYNRALTGNGLEMPMTKYFTERNPGERFGLGFGADMGTKLHGDEWPGYYPADAVRVTAYRLAQFATDLYGLPLLVFALPFLAFRRQGATTWELVFLGSGAALVVVYLLHFYHGIAYGSRHYYLALPSVSLLLAGFLVPAFRPGGEDGRWSRIALGALVLHTLAFAVPPLLLEYSRSYRGSSPIIRSTVKRQGLTNALVFVETKNWGWKSAFPLNRYPLERNDVIFARDLETENHRVSAMFPNRTVYYLTVGPDNRVVLRAAGAETRPTGQNP